MARRRPETGALELLVRICDLADGARGTYRDVYTVRFAGVVYVLDCFQKKSRRGITTAKPDLDLIKSRLLIASEDYRKRTAEKK